MKPIEDMRVIKTKTKLISTFRRLLEDKSFENITINEICDVANVRRATFYKHFSDKYAFLKFFVGNLRLEFDLRLQKKSRTESASAYYVEYLRGIVDFLTENEKIVENILKSDALLTLLEVIKEKNYEDTCDKLKESAKTGLKLPASIEITATMMTGAVAEALLHWYRTGRKMSKEALIAETSAVILKISNIA